MTAQGKVSVAMPLPDSLLEDSDFVGESNAANAANPRPQWERRLCRMVRCVSLCMLPQWLRRLCRRVQSVSRSLLSHSAMAWKWRHKAGETALRHASLRRERRVFSCGSGSTKNQARDWGCRAIPGGSTLSGMFPSVCVGLN